MKCLILLATLLLLPALPQALAITNLSALFIVKTTYDTEHEIFGQTLSKEKPFTHVVTMEDFKDIRNLAFRIYGPQTKVAAMRKISESLTHNRPFDMRIYKPAQDDPNRRTCDRIRISFHPGQWEKDENNPYPEYYAFVEVTFQKYCDIPTENILTLGSSNEAVFRPNVTYDR